ncbi:MAG: magnesium transporter, partial [Candidatus Aenigmatarchaeota archaeon]
MNTFSQSFLALIFDLGGIIAGGIAIYSIPFFSYAPWILIIYPSILQVRGTISGILCGKISTNLHIGNIKPQFFKNTKYFYNILISTFSLNIIVGIIIGISGYIYGFFILRDTIIDLFPIIYITLSSMIISSIITIPITITIAFLGFKKGLDPDILVYPILSTVADIIVTSCYIFSIWIYFKEYVFLKYSILSIILISSIITISYIIKNKHEKEILRTLKEATPLIALLGIYGNFTGSVLSTFRSRIEENPMILIVYPCLIDGLGDIGSIIGSLTSTRLVLGYLKPVFSNIKNIFKEIIAVESSAFIIHLLMGFLGVMYFSKQILIFEIINLAKITITTNLLSFLIAVLIGYMVAIYSFRFKLDPDNFVNPIVSAISDSIATIILSLVLYIYS